ncbi:MAG: metal-dependent transcriptional regulator [Candidatus Kariarchaeaceae archaeon]|jgi:Mn-dependent DtxR family transcriptional regulator
MSDLILEFDLTTVEKEVMREFIRLQISKAPVVLLGAEEVSQLLSSRGHEISRPRAYAILSRLEEKGILQKIKRKGFVPTEYGARVLRELLHRTKILEVYLNQELGMPLELASQEATELVLHVSFILVEILCKKLGKPVSCPHDTEIPHHDKHPDFVSQFE